MGTPGIVTGFPYRQGMVEPDRFAPSLVLLGAAASCNT